jgi:hypothetical protein
MDAGRWTIVSRATPQPRRPSQPYLRARVHVRCVCSLESVVWLEDIEQGRSGGCRSRSCHARFLASRTMRALLTRWIADERGALEELAGPEQAPELLRLADQLCTAQLARLDDVLADWLRAPVLAFDPSLEDIAEGLRRGA